MKNWQVLAEDNARCFYKSVQMYHNENMVMSDVLLLVGKTYNNTFELLKINKTKLHNTPVIYYHDISLIPCSRTWLLAVIIVFFFIIRCIIIHASQCSYLIGEAVMQPGCDVILQDGRPHLLGVMFHNWCRGLRWRCQIGLSSVHLPAKHCAPTTNVKQSYRKQPSVCQTSAALKLPTSQGHTGTAIHQHP